MIGQAGQAHVNDEKRVWMTMTNYPLVNHDSIPFNAEKMICLVRNPLDIIASCAFRHCLHSHNLKPQESLNQQFPEWWDKWVRETAENIQYSHTFIDDNLANKIPTYYIRYEDLVIDPEPVLTECFRFLLDVHSLEDTIIEARIKAVSNQGFDDVLSQATLKCPEENLNKNKHMYSEQQLKFIRTTLKDFALFMGYSNYYKAENDPTSFFAYLEGEIE